MGKTITENDKHYPIIKNTENTFKKCKDTKEVP